MSEVALLSIPTKL